MGGPIFSHVIFVDINFNFWKFQFFYSSTPMSLRLFLFTIEWLWSLSLLSIPIRSPIFSNYQSYLFYPFPYTMSIFYPFYTFLFILSILSIMFNFVHYVQFYPCRYPFSYILSFFVHSYLFCQFFPICPNLWSIIVHPYPLMFVHNLLCPKALFENSLQSWRWFQL